MAAAASTCPFGSDNQFGPRVNVACRLFDFTLLFEDAFFGILPAALFLLLLASRLQYLRTAPVKLASYKLAVYKLGLLALLFVLQVVYTAVQLRTASLHTQLSTTSGVLNILAIFAAALLSFMEDQRSVKPSDLIVIYFSVSSILSIARLRSLWLISSAPACRGLWTAVYILTVLTLLLESVTKTRLLRPVYRSLTNEQLIGFWGRSFFVWVLPIFRTGYSKVFEVEDLPNVDEALQGSSAEKKLQASWNQTKGPRRLLKATIDAYMWPLVSGIGPRLCVTVFTFCQPFLINATVNFMATTTTTPETKSYGQALVGAYALVYLGLTISTAVYWRQTFRLATMIRAGLISMIYRQTSLLKSSSMRGNEAITLHGTDVEVIVTSVKVIHEAWVSLLEVGVALWLLERQIFAACVVPAIICIVCVIAAGPLSTLSVGAQKAWVEQIEKRLAVTSTVLGDMKAVKMLGLTDLVFSIISALRKVELKTSTKLRKLILLQVSISNVPIDLAPFATFVVYAIIAAVKKDETLLASRAFTALSLISILTSPLLTFIQSLPSLVRALGCFQRIEEYCLIEPAVVSDDQDTTLPLPGSRTNDVEFSIRNIGVNDDTCLFKFRNANISWSPETETVLENLRLDIGNGITIIIGPVGSGKSALLESIIGETHLKDGTTTKPLTRVAYCSQNPWIINNTIKFNITNGSEHIDQKWYDFTIWACALEEDLKSIPGGDQFQTGSNGVSLSGGQKQRVALARAVYSRLPIVILDDVFSGLDSHSTMLISTRLFDQDGHFHRIIALNNGFVVNDGPYQKILAETPEIAAKSMISSIKPSISSEDGHSEIEKDSLGRKATKTGINGSEEALLIKKQDLSRRNGTWDVYKYYVKSAGYKTTGLFIFSILVSAFFSSFAILWLQWWSDANETQPNGRLGYYLGVYAAIFVLNFMGLVSACQLLFVNIINNTGSGMHSDLLRATLGAPFSFFLKTDTGTTTNRFSQDINLIDMDLPIASINFAANLSMSIFSLAILCIAGKYLAITVPFLGLAVFFLQLYYLRTSRQVRLLDIEAKSPLYTHFIETIGGIATVRAYGWESIFQDECEQKLNQSQKPFYMLMCIQIWLTLVLDLIVGIMAVILMATTTSLKDNFSPGSVGVGLNLVLLFGLSLKNCIRSWTQLETSIGAVSRVKSFVADTPSENRHLGTTEWIPPQEWPSQGAIIFEEVTATHSDDSPPILKNLSLKINAGEKVAICGPSGSGKTSLVMALLQMINLQSGRIEIDSRDLSAIECADLRTRINVIPQEPFFMPGTVRFNMDPSENKVSDETIEAALAKVGLWKRISANGGLEMALDYFQSVDWETEAIMQDVIEKEFSTQTVIAVVHRFRYIDRFDRVVLLNKGELVESDSPKKLLESDSEFKALYMALQKPR
uniref:Metal resistance protein YCF1 n=1 Tax=Talaromyces marneffei PM1 TaxID=1077442 RepID=A0A093VBK4_TALMA